MARLKRFSILLGNVLFALAVVSCAPSSFPPPPPAAAPPHVRPSNEDLFRAIDLLRKEDRYSAEGGIVLRGPTGSREGTYAMSIIGEDMDMTVFVKGVRAGRILLEKGAVLMEPRLLKDEYLEYMFAVILRDSILWWNISGFELLSYEPYHLIRNSWKKIYLDPVSLAPTRQIFRLMGFRSVEVRYADSAEFGFVRMPSRIEFSYGGYDCVLTIDRLTRTGPSGGY